MLTKINRDGAKGVLYNLSFAKLFDNWENLRKDALRYIQIQFFITDPYSLFSSESRRVIPEPMLKLSRTAKNFSLVMAIAQKVGS